MSKKRKSVGENESVIEDLQELLNPLAGEAALPLSLLSSAAVVSNESSALSSPQQEHALDQAKKVHLDLFGQHIGKYDDVLDSASKHAHLLLLDDMFCHNSGCEHVTSERYTYRHINGPRPDPCVWVGLFLGKAKEEELRAEKKERRESGEPEYGDIYKAISREAKELPVLILARNVLLYLQQEADRLKDSRLLLRFCAIYGLSGAMRNVVESKYGASISIDALLPVNISSEKEEEFSLLCNPKLHLPAYAIGAVLGHCHVIRQALLIGAKIDAPMGTSRGDKPSDINEINTTPRIVLEWVIKKKQSESLKCLVTEYGFQFRWISDELEDFFNLLFHINGMGDEFGVWRGRNYNGDRYWGDRRAQRRYRSKCCYKEKQEMLRTLIELGLPRELFLPTVDVELDHQLQRDAEKKGLTEPDAAMQKAFAESLTRQERKAREFVGKACAEYNAVQKKSNMLSAEDFYNQVRDMWQDQPTVQQARLDDFENLDPRWEEFEEKGEDAFQPWWVRKNEYESDSDVDDYDYEAEMEAAGLAVRDFSSESDSGLSDSEESDSGSSDSEE